MKPAQAELIFVVAAALLIPLLGQLFWFLPAIITLPIIFTYNLNHPTVYLVSTALIMEFFATLPPGVAALIVFLPLVIHRLSKKVTVDLSISFIAIIFFTATLQLLVLFLPDVIVLKDISILPWPTIITIISFSSVFSYILTIFVKFNRRW